MRTVNSPAVDGHPPPQGELSCAVDPDAWSTGDLGEDMREVRRAAAQIYRAARTCRTCPALRACRDWLVNLEPDQRPGGTVTAAQIVTGEGNLRDPVQYVTCWYQAPDPNVGVLFDVDGQPVGGW